MTTPPDRERLVDELHATHCAGDIDAETCNCDVWHARRAIVDAFDMGHASGRAAGFTEGLHAHAGHEGFVGGFTAGKAAGAAEERAAIVAWLRSTSFDLAGRNRDEFADDIESAAHTPPADPAKEGDHGR